MIKKNFNIPNMSCSHCQHRIETTFDNLNGIKSFEINLAEKTGWLEFDDSHITSEQIVTSLSQLNYDLEWSD